MNSRVRAFAYSSLILTAIETVLGILCYIFFFDSEVGYFNSSFLTTLFVALVTLTVIGAAVYAKFFIPEEETDINTTPCRYTAIFPAAGYLSLSVFFGFEYFSVRSGALLNIYIAALSLIASIYYIMKPFVVEDAKKPISAALGFAAIATHILVIFSTNLDYFVAVNSPIKIFTQFAGILCAVSALLEIRAIVRRPAKKMHLFITSASTLLCLVTSVTLILAVAFGKLPFSLYTVWCFAFFGVSVYGIASLVSIATGSKNVKTCDASPEADSESIDREYENNGDSKDSNESF
ncbi:MAG: hypothetical protein UH851_04265 [Clostridia bacterium]|nr:hypothetical protein [Clostridia bacterium]